ncbi:Copper resistance protein A [Legionella busanensis]|uniref:Copper resistance protein A n=1 Tax=Legionella busanensis TaxID=190655 RepID=A0A378KDN7_9GAMM|nr:Copper resistance protein A [Legionella busanensis]
MDLHRHVFEVNEIDGKPIHNGLLYDMVLVLPNSIVQVQFATDNPVSYALLLGK